ncbi:MAG: efflux RND transporter periplasmic adaptor subunit, partial [Xanthomonadales bacterium]|nr:efflux RND transporter periplasmic adaptor subunit [Xanthomonadales bacterium]
MKSRSERKPSTTKRMIIMGIFVGGFLALLIAWNLFGQYMASQAALQSHVPPQTVTSMKVGKDFWQPEHTSVGSLRAARGADLAFDVSGLVSAVRVKSGEEVKQGQLLVELNADDLVAQRRQLEANAVLLKTNLERARQQLAYKGISQADFDSAEASYKAAQAGVAQQQALVDKRQLRAPFSGRVGIVSLNPGSYVNSGDVVMTLQQVDPIFVDLNVPQGSLAEIKVGQTAILTLDSFADHPFIGEVTAISPKLDPATRNVEVEASVPNPDQLLKPGMFANVAIQVGQQKEFLTLPQTAITFNPYGETVFLVKPSDKKDAQGKPGMPTAQSVFV